MHQPRKKTHELRNRCLFTLVMIFWYMLCRAIVLFGVDPEACGVLPQDSQEMVLAMVSGDRCRYTLMALGIMPGILAGILVEFGLALAGKNFRSRISQQRIRWITFALMLLVSFLYACSRARELVPYVEPELSLVWVKWIQILEMTGGASILYLMCEAGKELGIGGQTAIILFNIGDSFYQTLSGHSTESLNIPLVLCLAMAGITLFMENASIRLPVQRVSIHNEYADKDYLEFKMNPIGVMPVMFATVLFMVPQMLVRELSIRMPENQVLSLLHQQLILTEPAGAVLFLILIFFQTLLFTYILQSPSDIADRLQRSGDSLTGVYPGKKTVKYLKRKLFLLSCFSGTVLCVCMGLSLFLSIRGLISSDLAMLPSTAMIFTGIFCMVVRETAAYRRFDRYRFFMKY